MFNQPKCVPSISPKRHGGLCLQGEAFAFPNEPHIYHHSIISSLLTSKVNHRNAKLKLGFTDLWSLPSSINSTDASWNEESELGTQRLY